MRDLHNNLAVVHAISAQVVNTGGGAVNSGDLDLRGFESAEFLVNFGANGGDTLNGTNKFTVTLEHSADDGAGSPAGYAAVGANDVLGVTPDVSGVVLTVDDAAEDAASYRFGYIGGKRFVKLTITPNGTLANGNPVAANLVKGHPDYKPVS